MSRLVALPVALLTLALALIAPAPALGQDATPGRDPGRRPRG